EEERQKYPLHSIDSEIVIRQIPSLGLSFQLWPAAASLVAILDRHRNGESTPLTSILASLQPPLRILELGSGTGLGGIAAAALLGARVTVTDLPHVVPNLQFNVDANAAILQKHGGAVDAAPLSWGDAQEMEAIKTANHDLILGSDLVYHDHLYEPLLETLKFLMSGSEKRVVFLMAHLKRWKKESVFFKKAKRLFDVEVIHTDSPSVTGSRTGVRLYRFVSKS
ncbi:hypothetical protein M569_15903, partial [Genlisea aurea]